MAESIKPLFQFFGLAVSLFGAYWVWQDSNRLKRNGAHLTPAVWTLVVFLFWLVSLPIYLLLRRTTWRSHVSSALEADHSGA
jgi:hypothetical protein